ncbi:stage II sporulation protein M [Cellulomonas denverensis]|uniref:stage II sporulation protein M n=1 Tax=Cellulomonas denverensis TaxID=264297 RepID=UPI0035E8C238
MDIDAFLAVRQPTWDRMDQLARRSRLSGAETDELIRLYQSAATDLSTVRSAAPDPDTVTRLSQSLARARATIAGRHEPAWRDITRFLMIALPAALYRIRWWTVAVTVVCVALAAVSAWWVATEPGVLDAMMTPEQQQEYVQNAFAEYYQPGAGFAGVVWTNNAWIAALCIGIGITGVGPAYILLSNALNIGAVAGLMATHDSLGVFFSLILPHGMLELTSVFVAGAAGLKLCWAWIVPGGRPRARALAEEGRALITVAIGLVLALFVSGMIEGFVTGSSLPAWLKILIGAVALAGFWAYTIVLGRRAVRAGETGDLSEDEAGYTVAVAG